MTDSPQKKPPRRVRYTLSRAIEVLEEAGVRSTAELRDEEEQHKGEPGKEGRS